MRIEVVYITHQGKIRKHNEDSIILLNQVIQIDEMPIPILKKFDEKKAIFAVADGMGGHSAGEIASRKVLEYMANKWESIDSVQEIIENIQNSHFMLIEYARKNPGIVNFGTTIAGLWISNFRGVVFNVGDSRIYRINQGYLEQISKDQSLVQSLIEKGQISEEDAKNHPKKNVILESIGGILDRRKIKINFKEINIKEKDSFMICSDGVSDILSVDEIENNLKGNSIQNVKNIFDKIMAKGGCDNISIILININK